MQLGTEEIGFKFPIRCKIQPKKPQIPAASAMDRSKPNRRKNVGARLADKLTEVHRQMSTEFRELRQYKPAEALLHLFVRKTDCMHHMH